MSAPNGEFVFEDIKGIRKLSEITAFGGVDNSGKLEELEKRISEIEKNYVGKITMYLYIFGAMIITFLGTLVIKRRRRTS